MGTEAMGSMKRAMGEGWREEGGGYWSMSVQGPFSLVAYVALPEDHPDVGSHYNDVMTEENDWGPDVNGGLTYSNGNVFGWDYGHHRNSYDVAGDIERALDFFRERAETPTHR